MMPLEPQSWVEEKGRKDRGYEFVKEGGEI